MDAIPVVTEVKVLPQYRLEVHFRDGFCRVVDMADQLDRGVFRPLKDPARFAEAYVDPISRTVAWPNGVDLAPEWLYEPDPDKYWKKVHGNL